MNLREESNRVVSEFYLNVDLEIYKNQVFNVSDIQPPNPKRKAEGTSDTRKKRRF